MARSTWAINCIVRLAGWMQVRALRIANRTPHLQSALTLRSILLYAKDTEYGKEHHFAEILAATSDAELYNRYRQNVPVNDYEALRPYVEKQKEGYPDILIPGKPVMYATTSGTTNHPKWVPISERYLKNVYSKMTRVWLYNFVQHRKKVFAGSILFVVGKDIEGYASDGTPYGSVSGVTQRDAPEFVRRIYASVPEIFQISDYAARYYTLMRLGIEADITLLLMPNPSTMLEMQSNVEQHINDMIDDIEHGTLSDKFEVSAEIRSALAHRMKPNPKRAQELRRLQQKGTIMPKDYWPNLQLLSTWKCGNTQIYLDKFKDFFSPETFHQELGYFATECRFGLALGDSLNSTLFPHFHYYEFVEEHELDSPNPHFYQLCELEEGKRYCSYVTTYSGLYRYNMNDLIEAGPRYYNTPTVHMVQKINGIISLTGEKLHESQFIKAVKQAIEMTELQTKFFVGFASTEDSQYHFYYEFANAAVTQAQAETFTRVVDNNLQEINIEYAAKRASNRLEMPRTHRLQDHSYKRFKSMCVAEGMRDGQFKLNLLMQDPKRQSKFNRLCIASDTKETKAEE